MNSEGQPFNTSCHQIPSMPVTSLIHHFYYLIYVFNKRRGRKKMFTEKYPNFYSVLVFSSVSRLSSLPGQLHEHVTCAVPQGDTLGRAAGVGLWLSCHRLNVLIFEQGAPYSHFALRPANYVDHCF